MQRRQVQRTHADRIISGASAGLFFVLVGAIFLSTPDLISRIITFFNGFTLVNLPHIENVLIPVPTTPGAYVDLYRAYQELSLVWGIIQIFILALCFVIHSSTRRKAESVSDIVFWLGNSYLISYYLTPQLTVTGWLIFWSMIITLIGVSQVARGIVLAVLTR